MNQAVAVKRCRLIRPIQPPGSASAGFRFPSEVIRLGTVALSRTALRKASGEPVFRIEMHREDMSFTKLILIRGANGCGFNSGRAQRNGAYFRHPQPRHVQRATATGVNLQSRCLIPLMKGESRRSGSPTLSMSGTRSKSWRNITSISWRAR